MKFPSLRQIFIGVTTATVIAISSLALPAVPTAFGQSVNDSEKVVPVVPIEEFACSNGGGTIHANSYPSLDSKLEATIQSTDVITAGAILSDQDDMNVFVNGTAGEKVQTEYANLWVKGINITNTVSLITGSGPDHPWTGYTIAGPFIKAYASINPDGDNTYPYLAYNYVATGSQAAGCLFGSGENGEINFIIFVNGVQAQVGHSFHHNVDLQAWGVKTKKGDLVSIKITGTEYFLVGMNIEGVEGMPAATPHDPNPNPNPNPNLDECAINLSSTPVFGATAFIDQELKAYLTASGNCGRVVYFNYRGLGAVQQISDGCFVFDDYGKVLCDLEKVQQATFVFKPKLAGQAQGFVTMTTDSNAPRYAGGIWEIRYGEFLPMLLRQ